MAWLLTALAALAPSAPQIRAQSGFPLVRTYEGTPSPSQGAVWAVTRSRDGTLWVGSNKLASFDGRRWETLELPNAYAFRALAPGRDDAIWVGARGAVGCLRRDATGRWQFESLAAPLAAAGVTEPGDVWFAQATSRGAIFVTSDRAIRWNGEKIETWPLPANPHLQAFSDGEAVLIYQFQVGLLRLTADGPPTLIHAERDLPAKPVTWFLPGRAGGEALIGLGDGAYRRLADGGFERLEALSAALRGTLPSYAEWLDDASIALGTFRAGVLVASAAGDPRRWVNRLDGLSDDSVYALAPGRPGELWVGLGNGLVHLDHPGQATLFDRRAGLGQGAPRKVLALGAQVYALTTREIFRVEDDSAPVRGPRPPAMTALVDPQAILWDTTAFDGQLWFGGFGGIWRMDGAHSVREYSISADVLQMSATTQWPRTLVFTEGYALKALQPSTYGWASRDLGPKVNDTPVSLWDDGHGSVWVATMVGGIQRFAWIDGSDTNRTPRLRPAASYGPGRGLPPAVRRPRLTTVGGRLFLFTDTDILGFLSDETGFGAVPALADELGIAAVASGADTAYWLVQSRRLPGQGASGLVRVRTPAPPAPPTVEFLGGPGLGELGDLTSLDLIGTGAATALWIGGTRGWLRLDPGAIHPASPAPRIRLRRLQVDATLQALAPAAPAPLFGAASKRVAFEYSAEEAGEGRPVFYQTMLTGIETGWSAPTPGMSREFTGLAAGSYVFEARALDAFGRAGPALAYAFGIEAPWYVRWPAIVGEGVAAGLLALAVVRWRTRRLQRQNEQLNRLVAERTRELELANTAKSEFLESISHEIRNPLNGLNGLLGLLRRENVHARARELTDSVQVCAKGLTRIFEEVLGFSRLEYGGAPLQETAFALRQVLSEVVAAFAWQAGQQGSRVQLHETPLLDEEFCGDENKIQTIVGNFVGNAIKYAPGSAIELKVESQPAADGGVDAFIEVCDAGPGIPPEEQELIFKKFVRGSHAKAGHVSGAGLGLATCRVLAHALGGSVGVDSEPGHGAIFYLRVPLRRAPPAAPPATAPGAALIVEDEHYNQIVLRGLALELGYEPAVAGSAEQALALLAAQAFAVIFLDWQLPGLSGGEVARRVRAQPNGAQPVIFAMTAHDSAEIRQQCLAAGMDDFVLKPYAVAHVRRRIAQALARRRGEEPPAEPPGEPPTDGLNLRAFEHYARGAPGQGDAAVQHYLAAIDHELAALDQAVRDGAADRIVHRAHRLRALGGLVGAQDLTRLAQRLEAAARSRETAGHAQAFLALTAAAAALKLQLAELMPAVAVRG